LFWREEIKKNYFFISELCMNGIGSLDKEVIQKIEMPPGSSLFLSVNVPYCFYNYLMFVIFVSLPLFVPFQSFFVFYQRFCKAYNNCFFIRKCFASLYKKTILQKYFQSYTRNKKYCFYSTFICKWYKIVLLTKIRSKIKLHTKITFFFYSLSSRPEKADQRQGCKSGWDPLEDVRSHRLPKSVFT
jgi:hypothetical protein